MEKYLSTEFLILRAYMNETFESFPPRNLNNCIIEEQTFFEKMQNRANIFTPTPPSYNSSPLDGVAWNYITWFLIYLDM